MTQSICICGTKINYEACCGKYHHGATAETAEALMRSRFSAFALHNDAYLLNTWAPATRPAEINSAENLLVWKYLQIVGTQKGRVTDNNGTVEFKAFYEQHEELYVIHELSRFKKEAGRWFYVNGTMKFMGKATPKHLKTLEI